METTINIKNLHEKEVGYVVGLFIGDGYKHYSKLDRHYIVDFYLNSERDKDIISFIESLLQHIGLRVFRYKDKRSNTMRIRVNSKRLFLFIETEIKDLYETGRASHDYFLGLLSGFVDAEGYIGNGEILLTQKDYGTLKLIKDLCESHNILTRKFWSSDNYKTHHNIWRLRIATQFKYAPHISKKLSRIHLTI